MYNSKNCGAHKIGNYIRTTACENDTKHCWTDRQHVVSWAVVRAVKARLELLFSAGQARQKVQVRFQARPQKQSKLARARSVKKFHLGQAQPVKKCQ